MKHEINIPFDGFYESVYSWMIDDVLEREAEYRHEQENIPETEESDFWDIIDNHANYGDMEQVIVDSYVDIFASETGLTLDLKEMVSPKEYNFTTDMIYCDISESDVKMMFDVSKADKHKTLEYVIKERHTSRSGFISFYDNDIDKWLAKPVADWDHNELNTLLRAYMIIQGFDSDISEYVSDNVCGNGLLDDCIDWQGVENAINDLRHTETGYIEPRCDKTKSLPL